MRIIYSKQLFSQLQDDSIIKNIHGYTFIDSFSYDNYTIFLSQINYNLGPDIPKYQIGIVRNDQTSFTPEDQVENKKFKMPFNNPFNILKKFTAKINEWVNTYGPLLAASNNPKKNRNYKIILTAIGVRYKTINKPQLNLEGLIIY